MPPDSEHLQDEQPPAPVKKQTPVAKLAAPVTPTTECEQHANGARCTEPKKSPQKKSPEKKDVGASLVGEKNRTGAVQTSDGRVTG